MRRVRKKPIEEVFEFEEETETIKELQQLEIAIRAARFLSRPPIIAALTGLPQVKARNIFRDVVGHAPNKGQLPSDTAFYVNDAQRHLESAWLAQSYRMTFKKGGSKIEQCHSLFLTYEHYLEHFANPLISFDRFFFLVRFTFFSKTITLSSCKECDCAKLKVNNYNPKKIINCPVCYLSSETGAEK